MTWCILFFIILIIYNTCSSDICVTERGLVPLHRNDMAMVFYVIIKNHAKSPVHVVTKMKKCCEHISNQEIDCEVMELIGGDFGILPFNKTLNLTLIYPNLYLHNRQGECAILIHYRGTSGFGKKITTNIKFNTMLSKFKVPSILKGYYTLSEMALCDSIDEDPLDNCLPVNCAIKYSGHRNYYSYKKKLCEKVPLCLSDPKKRLPNVGYVPMNNNCRDLEKPLTAEDLKRLKEDNVPLEKDNSNRFQLNLRCHHGKLDKNTGLCVCDDKWISAPFSPEDLDMSITVIHMCTIQVCGGKREAVRKALIIGLISIAIAMFIVIAVACLRNLCIFCSKFEASKKMDDSDLHTTFISVSKCQHITDENPNNKDSQKSVTSFNLSNHGIDTNEQKINNTQTIDYLTMLTENKNQKEDFRSLDNSPSPVSQQFHCEIHTNMCTQPELNNLLDNKKIANSEIKLDEVSSFDPKHGKEYISSKQEKNIPFKKSKKDLHRFSNLLLNQKPEFFLSKLLESEKSGQQSEVRTYDKNDEPRKVELNKLECIREIDEVALIKNILEELHISTSDSFSHNKCTGLINKKRSEKNKIQPNDQIKNQLAKNDNTSDYSETSGFIWGSDFYDSDSRQYPILISLKNKQEEVKRRSRVTA